MLLCSMTIFGNNLSLNIGTSGDTGSAAIEAVRGMKWVDIVVLLPRGRCSNIQEKQMTTVLEDNVHVFRGTLLHVCLRLPM